MIKLILNQKIEKEHLDYFNKHIIKKLELPPKAKNSEAQKSVDDLFSLLRNNARDLAIGLPIKLRKIATKVNSLRGDLLEQKVVVENNEKSLHKYLEELFNYEKFSDTPTNVSKECIRLDNYIDIKTTLFDNWSAYKLVYASGIRVCPYCNRQYITPIYIKNSSKETGHRLRPDLDHFYPKKTYPYLSMSLYNLVPCCKFCNSSLKNGKKIFFDDVNPYERSFDDHFKFKYDIIRHKVFIEKNEKDQQKIDNLLDIFQIQNLYFYHENIVDEILKKKEIYPDSHVEELFNQHQSLFKHKEEIVELIFGNRFDREKLNDEVLLKFRNDIVDQFEKE